MKKILTVLGARPQFIKASAVSAAIRQLSDLREIVVHTGQHFDNNMSNVFFSELGMDVPAYELNIHGGGHGDMTGRMLIAIEQVLKEERPDVLMVYGDTNSTLAGALAAIKMHIPVAHVEAGLRSFNMNMPEEVNRILTDRISQWLFTPTDIATTNLCKEGTPVEKICQTGDVMFDVALLHGSKANKEGGLLKKLGLPLKSYILVTIHRAENTDDIKRLTAIALGIKKAAARMPIVWPVHPRTKQALVKANLLESLEKSIYLIDPVGYLDMVQLEKHAALIATDSGGVQKEAFFHQIPCVTLRAETEWTELVEAGWNHLVLPDNFATLDETIQYALNKSPRNITPYGKGNAAELIASALR